MGCEECGMAYSFYFGTQYHKADCLAVLADEEKDVRRCLVCQRVLSTEPDTASMCSACAYDSGTEMIMTTTIL